MSKTIIGFAGRKRAGKTCLSKYLCEKHNGTVITVADALKHLCCKLLDVETIDKLNEYKDSGNIWCFNADEYSPNWTKIICEEVFGDYTSTQYNEILKLVRKLLEKPSYDVRQLLQFIGTDIIRKYRPNWHVDKMIEAINNATTELICVDDVRFPNERDAVEKLGGTVFFVIRPDLRVGVSNHVSEVSLTWSDFNSDRVIVNRFEQEYFFNEFDEAYKHHFVFTNSSPLFKCFYDDYDKCNQDFGVIIGSTSPNEEYDFIKNVIVPNIVEHNGCIVLNPDSCETMNKYCGFLYKNKRFFTTDMLPIVIWNPFIIENLKAWL